MQSCKAECDLSCGPFVVHLWFICGKVLWSHVFDFGSTRLTSTDHLCRGWNTGILGQGANDPGRNAESVWILMLVAGKEGRPESLAKGGCCKSKPRKRRVSVCIYVYIYIRRIIVYFCFWFLTFLQFPS